MGRVVFVSSQAGQLGLFGFTAYSPSKFAIRGLAEALQMEVRAVFRQPSNICSALVGNFLTRIIVLNSRFVDLALVKEN